MNYRFSDYRSTRHRGREPLSESVITPSTLPEITPHTPACAQNPGGEVSYAGSTTVLWTALFGTALLRIVTGFIAVALVAIGRADRSAIPEVLRGLAALVRALLRLPH